jgi:hypothetical protein
MVNVSEGAPGVLGSDGLPEREVFTIKGLVTHYILFFMILPRVLSTSRYYPAS